MDVIFPRREELCFPKTYSDINIMESEYARQVKISWQGAEWTAL